MPIPLQICSSVSLLGGKKEFNPEKHFRWVSIKKFVYMAYTFSSAFYNFDIFSKNMENGRIFDFVFYEITIGMAYMFMDCFIKQYTRKTDAHQYLNPLLKGITYCMFLQTALWALLHAVYVADSLHFLVSSVQVAPSWSLCHISVNVTCVPAKDVIIRCQSNKVTNFNTTSAHFNYLKSFKHFNRGVMTSRLFVIGLVWIFNFFFSTVTDDILLKMYKLIFMFRSFSTLATLGLMLITNGNNAVKALTEILDSNADYNYTASLEHVTYTYGIGFLSFYDGDNISPYTMTDNAVIIFTLIYTTAALLRSWIIKILYRVLTKCVAVEIFVTPHYFMFAVLPLSTDFFHAHKLYTIYIFMNLFVSCSACLTTLTLSMTKLLHSEIQLVKNVYVVGLLCVLGFGITVPVLVSMTAGSRGLLAGLNVIVLYLGGFKVAVIMWVYGVQRFSTDIQFWLGFKPTKFWKTCWILLPITLSIANICPVGLGVVGTIGTPISLVPTTQEILLWDLYAMYMTGCFVIFYWFISKRIYMLTQCTNSMHIIVASLWIGFSVIIVLIFHIKTITKYLVQNNLAAAFSSSKKYGPPDPEERKKRRNFNDTIHSRQCQHNCLILDDAIDCNHLPVMKNVSTKSFGSESTVSNIFEEGTMNNTRTSFVLKLNQHH